MRIQLKKILFNLNIYAKNSDFSFIFSILSLFPLPVFADGLSEWSSATSALTASIRSFAPQIILLGIVFAAISAILWVVAPVSKKYTAWSWGVLGLIILVSIVINFYAGPIKNSFSSVLDPLKNLIPS